MFWRKIVILILSYVLGKVLHYAVLHYFLSFNHQQGKDYYKILILNYKMKRYDK